MEVELSKIDNNTTKAPESNSTEENNETKVDETIVTEDQLHKDIQLKSAVDILKALIITQKGKK